MRETYEFRIYEKYAPRLFHQDAGESPMGLVRKIKVTGDDPRFKQIGELSMDLKGKGGGALFSSWSVHRSYSEKEIAGAELFRLRILSAFEPTGEECGAVYDESSACIYCGAGRKQCSNLTLDLRKVPKTKDITRTIANEWIISQHLAQVLMDEHVSGVECLPVSHKARYQDDPIDLEKVPTGRELLDRAAKAGIPESSGGFWVWLNRAVQKEMFERVVVEHCALSQRRNLRSRKSLPVWHQLVITPPPLDVGSSTRFGINPYDEDLEGKYRCPLGHVPGLNLLSELHVTRSSWDGSDICCTKQVVGRSKGLLRPAPLIVISPRLARLLLKERIKGFEVEIVRLHND